MKQIVKALFFILVIGLIFYDGSDLGKSESFPSQFRSALYLPALAVKNILGNSSLASRVAKLELENKGLRSQKDMLSKGISFSKTNAIIAKVHASYPFNNKNAITIAAGKSVGVEPGDAVFVSDGIFLGTVSRADDSWSEVSTVFDINRKLPVRIGGRGVPALLTGGNTIKVSMIDKSKEVAEGEAVYTASRDLPYGVTIGSLKNIRDNSVGAFKEADVEPPYSILDLSEVYVEIKK